MNVVLWIVAGVLAAAFLGAGGMKAAQPKEKLAAEPRMGWTADFSGSAIKTIGALEVLGAIGLILPALLDIAPILVPIAATGLAAAMLGAIIVHARRNETARIVVPAVLFVLSAFVAWGRFGPYAF
ncbi:DoxX family protein [Actinokineospora globicatena]|uniref:DoxX family protein n=1 Tax=Actinokineospora globicatena TaxID=103729 RepID=UPI0020A5C6E4|nr:DoxX family protein [Actinokineospora globicatena]MCP2305998.1 DoxX-like family protein [Actinokineospora globicatena]GLW80131.1 hypothetical protein Aglo01_46120 [Actinokineospora globicatena]GLW86960.1 hypothetical protein Aglo02_45990 [Actinokineospora globicatena]